MRKGQVMKQHMALILMQLLSKKRQRKLTVAEFLETGKRSHERPFIIIFQMGCVVCLDGH